jgi:hypothetical protein
LKPIQSEKDKDRFKKIFIQFIRKTEEMGLDAIERGYLADDPYQHVIRTAKAVDTECRKWMDGKIGKA